MLARQKKLLNFILTKLKTRDGNDYKTRLLGKDGSFWTSTFMPPLKDPKNPINKNLREGIRDILEVIHHVEMALKKGLKEDCLPVPLLFPAPCTVQKTFKKGVKVIGKELEKGLKEAEKTFKVIGKELEKQLKKAACFSGTSTVQTRRGGIEIKNTFNIQNTKLDQIGKKRSEIWKWERGIGNGDLDYDDLNSVQ